MTSAPGSTKPSDPTLSAAPAAARAVDHGAGGVLSGRYRALTIGIVSCVLLVAFEATAVNTAMPVAARALHGLGLYAFAFSGYFTASLLAMVVSGEWADKRGPLGPLAAGIATFGVGLLIAGTAQDMWIFVAGRAVQGLGGGLLIVALYVVVGRAYPERLRGAVFAAFSASWVLPSIIGPVISGTVTQHLGWRWVFLSIPVLVLLPVSLMLPQLRRLQAEESAKEAAEAAAGGAPERGWGLDRRRILLAVALAAGTFFAAEAFIPLMLVTQRGLSPTLAGLSLTSGGMSWALGSWLQGRPWADRHRVLLIRLGFAMSAAAIAGAGLALVHSIPAAVVACAWTVGGAGMGMSISSVGVLMLGLSAPEETGENSASLQVSDALGNVLLTSLAGVLFTSLGTGSTGAFASIFATMAAVALVGTALCGRARAAGRG